MQKIYVLLRNDKQTGPYSLEEIIQFDLKPYDLIWIEGRSAGWYYPQEIGALHPYLSFVPKVAAPAVERKAEVNPVFVSMPAFPKTEDSFPSKTVETPIPRFEGPLVAQTITAQTLVVADTYKPFEPASKNIEEEVYAQFREPVHEKPAAQSNASVVAKPKRKSTVSVGGAIAAVLIVGGVFAASWIMNRHPADKDNTTTAYDNQPVQKEIADSAVAKLDNAKITKQSSLHKQKEQRNSIAPKQKAIAAKYNSPTANEPRVAVNNSSKETEDYSVPTPVKDDEQATKEETTSSAPAETTAAPQEKKKKLRDKILDIFKKKPEEQKSEEAKPAENDNGERRATHREDGANLAQSVNVRFDVPNSWMMGIKNAKATLMNHSKEKISKAVVEISYYDDDNQLLQKKTITFGKIEAKGSQTISIPDHSTATKVDYSIVSVSGAPSA